MGGAFTPFELELYLAVRFGAAIHDAAVEIENMEVIPLIDKRRVGESLEAANKALVFHLAADTVGIGFLDAPVKQAIDEQLNLDGDLASVVEQAVVDAVEKVRSLEAKLDLLYGDRGPEAILRLKDLSQRLVPEGVETLRHLIDDIFPIERGLYPASCEQVLKFYWAPRMLALGGLNYLKFIQGAAAGELQWDEGVSILLRAMAQRRATMAFLRSGLNSTGVETALRKLAETPDAMVFVKTNTACYGTAIGEALDRRLPGIERAWGHVIVEAYTAAHEDAILTMVEKLGPIADKIEKLSR